MEAIRLEQTVDEDGRLVLEGLPVQRGQTVEVIVLLEEPQRERRLMTVRELLQMDAIGMWADRDDIQDSAEFARKLRREAETRDWSDETAP